MTNNINRIGINTSQVNSYANSKAKNEEKTEEKQEKTNQQAAGAQVKPDDVLAFMAQNAVVNAPKVAAQKTYDIAKYVTPEQAERIAGFIGSFEGIVADRLKVMDKELGGTKLSESAKLELAAKMAEKEIV